VDFDYYSMSTNFHSDGTRKKTLPCITACPWQAFKERGFHYSEADYTNNTFGLEEIFDVKYAKNDLNNTSKYYVEEIRSVSLGRCHMVCPLKRKKQSASVIFKLRKGQDITGITLNQ